MFGIGMPEMLLILAVALIVIGPKKLPDLAKSLGKALGEFKKATSELKESIHLDSELKEVKTAFDDINRDLKKSPGDRPVKNETPPPADDTTSPANGGDGEHSDPIDSVKQAFDRHQTPPPASDAEAPQGDASAGGSEDAETPKG